MVALLTALTVAGLSGCSTMTVAGPTDTRPFDFRRDTFSYTNELDWEYRIDPATGKVTAQENRPAPEFSHRCFAVSHMAREFFRFARFDPTLPKADEADYHQLIAEVVAYDGGNMPDGGKIVIPGYADLRSFSAAEEVQLKTASGSALHSYFQLSNWRMIFPFSRDGQEEMASRLLDEVRANQQPIVHLIRFSPFPLADINHVVMIFSAADDASEIRFSVYDPNNSAQPVVLTFDRSSRHFIFPTTNYFADGPVNVYEIFLNDAG